MTRRKTKNKNDVSRWKPLPISTLVLNTALYLKVVLKDICYYVLPTLKYFQYFVYSLFYAWTVNLLNKMDMSACSFLHNLMFSAFDQFSGHNQILYVRLK